MLKHDHVLLLKTCFLSLARYPSGSKYRCGSVLGQLLHGGEDEPGLQFVRLGPARARKLNHPFLSSPVVQDGKEPERLDEDTPRALYFPGSRSDR